MLFSQPVRPLQLYFAHDIAEVGELCHLGFVEGVSEMHQTVTIITCFGQGPDEDNPVEGQFERIPMLWELQHSLQFSHCQSVELPLYLDFGDGTERGRPSSPGSRQTVQ